MGRICVNGSEPSANEPRASGPSSATKPFPKRRKLSLRGDTGWRQQAGKVGQNPSSLDAVGDESRERKGGGGIFHRKQICLAKQHGIWGNMLAAGLRAPCKGLRACSCPSTRLSCCARKASHVLNMNWGLGFKGGGGYIPPPPASREALLLSSGSVVTPLGSPSMAAGLHKCNPNEALL